MAFLALYQVETAMQHVVHVCEFEKMICPIDAKALYCLFVDVGTWRSLVARLLWEQDVAGSNPVVPTIYAGVVQW